MATWYVDSTATGGSGAGTSWTNACLTVAAAIALSAAGDDFNVYSGHAETQATAMTWTFKGTPSAPNRVFSCDRTNSPAQASDLLAGASATTTTNAAIGISGMVYIYGLTFNGGSGTTAGGGVALLNTSIGDIFLDTCQINLPITTAASSVTIHSNGNGARAILLNTPINFSSAASSIILNSAGDLYWRNTALAVAGTSPTNLFTFANNPSGLIVVDGVDLSGVASGKTLVAAASGNAKFQFINCKLASGVPIAASMKSPK